MDHRVQTLPADIAIGLFAGLVATQVTNLAQRPLQWMTPASIEQQEKRVRPGDSSSLVAARRVADYLNRSPDQQQMALLGKAIHFGVGTAWGPVYGLLRRYGGLKPFGAGLTAGAAMSLILDGGVVPVLGLSASNRDYPVFTHVRGLLAHLAYGAAVAMAAEGFGRLAGRSPEPARWRSPTKTGKPQSMASRAG